LGSPPEKGKKKNLGINPGQLAGKGREKNPGINPGQLAEKGREKKTLVLTLGSPPEKGGKKNLGINPGQLARKWQKKNPDINPGQPAGKGRGKKRKKRGHVRLSVEVLKPRIETSTDRQTHRQTHGQTTELIKRIRACVVMSPCESLVSPKPSFGSHCTKTPSELILCSL
jgi:hypothetical protein